MEEQRTKTFEEKVIEISRVSRTVKGGKRIGFRALVICGDRKGRVGIGLGKANEVASAIKKAVASAKKNLVTIKIDEKGTILREIMRKDGSAQVLLKPAPEGTSIIAGGVVRAVAELSGIRNLVTKSIGTSNKINVARTTLNGLKEASSYE